jgi:hypothetical protein
MKNIEINSDKTTVSIVVCVLVVMLVTLLSNLYGLLVHRPVAPQSFNYGLIAGAIFNTCVAVILCRDSKIRKAYPYGLAGFCLYASLFFVEIALPWAKASVATQNLLRTPMTVLNIVASGLILGEGVRWFRANVKLAKDAKLAEDVKLAEKKTGSEPHV